MEKRDEKTGRPDGEVGPPLRPVPVALAREAINRLAMILPLLRRVETVGHVHAAVVAASGDEIQFVRDFLNAAIQVPREDDPVDAEAAAPADKPKRSRGRPRKEQPAVPVAGNPGIPSKVDPPSYALPLDDGRPSLEQLRASVAAGRGPDGDRA